MKNISKKKKESLNWMKMIPICHKTFWEARIHRIHIKLFTLYLLKVMTSLDRNADLSVVTQTYNPDPEWFFSKEKKKIEITHEEIFSTRKEGDIMEERQRRKANKSGEGPFFYSKLNGNYVSAGLQLSDGALALHPEEARGRLPVLKKRTRQKL